MYAVKDKLRSRGIRCDNFCVRCGEEGESINHVLFECPPARQVWALSNIPTPLANFPRLSIWSKMDYLFWHLPDHPNNSVFPWILWNLWKARNDKAFSRLDKDPRDIISQAEQESEEWAKANFMYNLNPKSNTEDDSRIWKEVARPMVLHMAYTGFRCFVDAAYRPSYLYTGIAWCCFPNLAEDPSCGGRAIPKSLSACHAEIEAVLWAMECLISLGVLEVEAGTYCSDVEKIISYTEEWPAFSAFVEDFLRLKTFFTRFSIHVIPRTLNHRADILTHNFRG